MIEYNIELGEVIPKAYTRAVNLAIEKNDLVHFLANGVEYYADKNSNPKMCEVYLDRIYKYNIKEFGPSEPVWTEEFVKQKEEEALKELEETLKKWREKEAQEEFDYLEFKKLVKGIELELIDIEEYNEWKNKNKDYYSSLCFTYAEDLMKYLQYIKNLRGTITKDDVTDGEHKIRRHSITGFQHYAVVSIIKNCWKHFNHSLFDR